MAEKLHHIIEVNNELYTVTAGSVANKLKINVANGENKTYTYDGSSEVKIDLTKINDADHADVAKKVENALTINVVKNGETAPVTFDGSEPVTIDIGDVDSAKMVKKI
jgi:hypothetical protein